MASEPTKKRSGLRRLLQHLKPKGRIHDSVDLGGSRSGTNPIQSKHSEHERQAAAKGLGRTGHEGDILQEEARGVDEPPISVENPSTGRRPQTPDERKAESDEGLRRKKSGVENQAPTGRNAPSHEPPPHIPDNGKVVPLDGASQERPDVEKQNHAGMPRFHGGNGLSLDNPRFNITISETQGDVAGMFQGSSGHTFIGGHFIQNNNAQASISAKEILDQLPTKHNFRSIQIDTFDRVTHGTGTWVLDEEEFQGWTDSNGGMLWGIGAPGAGKTFLASIVVDHLETRAAHAEPKISVAFVYCRYYEEITVVDVLLSLVKQQLERDPSLTSIVDPILARHRLEKTTPSQGDLLKMLKDIAQYQHRSFYIIDALDELPKAIQSKLLELLASVNANIFITSRPFTSESMKTLTPNAKYIDIAAHDHDIELFITEKIVGNPEFCTLLDENGVRDKVIASIVEKCSGRFLHAALQIEMLQHCYSPADLEETMEQLPFGIEDLYKADLKRIERQPRKHAKLGKYVLLWVINVARPITFEELQFALTFSEETKTFNPKDLAKESLLLSFCCGLVTVEKESRLVRLVHHTAKEVLPPLLVHDHPQPNSIIADTCISRLISCDFHSQVKPVFVWHILKAYNANPLLAYAHHYFGVHSLRCDISTEVRKRTAQFVRQCRSFPGPLYPGHWQRWTVVDKMNSLHMAAYYNFVDISEGLLGDKASTSVDRWDVDIPTPSWHNTALILAGLTGNTAMVRCLVDVPGLDVNLTNKCGWTALMIASRYGHESTVRFLLDLDGIDINLTHNVCSWTAFGAALYYGHETILRLFLGSGRFSVNNVVYRGGWTPLILASKFGYESIVRLLLGVEGINANLADSDGRTALMATSRNGHQIIVQLLLDVDGIDVNLADKDGQTALFLASEGGHESIIRLLLKVDAININLAHRDGSTALIIASKHGYESVVRLLLGMDGIDVNLTTQDGWTALMFALDKGHASVVQLLLNVDGINANLTNQIGWSALMIASRYAPESISKALLQVPGIQTHFVGDEGDTALIFASERGHEEVVALILRTPCSVNAATHVGGWTALMFSASRGQEGIVRLILQSPDVDVDLKDQFGCTAREWASIYGHDEVVKLLTQYSSLPI